MITEIVDISELRNPERNVRVHPENQIIELMRSIELFDITRPAVLDEKNTILVGNGLVEACRRLGRNTIPALRMSGLSEAAKRKLMLADNKIFELGIDDNAAIMQLVKELEGDYDIPGYDSELLSRLTAEVAEATEQSMQDYGRINDEEEKQFTDKPIPEGTQDSEGDNPGDDENVCPRCGRTFVR